MAQVYGVYDWHSLPLKTVATLAAGLPEDSRSVRAATGQAVDLKTMLLAAITDRLSILIWQQTKDAQKGKNKPKMILDTLGKDNTANEVKAFASGAEFEAARQRFFKG